MKEYTIIILLLFITFGCKKPKTYIASEETIAPITISLEKSDKPMDLSNSIDEITYLPLETKKESLIGTVSKVIRFNDKYVVADKKRGKIFLFDNKGKFISTIGEKGHGPKEYVKLEDIEINKKDTSLVVIGNVSPLRLIYYSLNNSASSEKEYRNLSGQRFSLSSSNSIITHDMYPFENKLGYGLCIADNKGSIVSRHLCFKKINDVSKIPINVFSHLSDTILFHKYLNDTVYQIINNKISKRYYVYFEKYTMPQSVKNLFNNDIESFHKESRDYISGIDNFLEIDDFIFFEFSFKGESYTMYFSKQNSIIKCSSTTEDNITDIIMQPISVSENEFIAVLDPASLFEMKELIMPFGEKFWKQYCKDIRIPNNVLESVKPTSNPILVTFKLSF